MAIAVGYNVTKAEEVMTNIASAYNNLGIYTAEQWNGVVTALQDNWIGEDEQDFEEKLADRICKLYENAYQLANSSVETIASLTDAWYEFQANNTIDGGRAGSKGRVKVNKPKIKSDSKIVKARKRTFSESDDRGLVNTASNVKIQDAVQTFVNEITSKTKGLFSEIETNNAFFGGQTTSIKAYIEKCGFAIGEVTVAVKDMNDALNTLANSSYEQASTDISQEFDKASTNVEQSLGDLGNSRWS